MYDDKMNQNKRNFRCTQEIRWNFDLKLCRNYHNLYRFGYFLLYCIHKRLVHFTLAVLAIAVEVISYKIGNEFIGR